MKAETTLKKVEELRLKDEREAALKGLSALMITTNSNYGRLYLQQAIDYIETH